MALVSNAQTSLSQAHRKLTIIPIQRISLHFRPRSRKHPLKLQLDVLHQMARKLHMSHISRMILRSLLPLHQ